jgi:hypothetical protein
VDCSVRCGGVGVGDVGVAVVVTRKTFTVLLILCIKMNVCLFVWN